MWTLIICIAQRSDVVKRRSAFIFFMFARVLANIVLSSLKLQRKCHYSVILVSTASVMHNSLFVFFRTDEADSPPNPTLRLTLLHIRITNQFISRGGLRNNLMLPKVGNRKIMTRKYVLSGLNEEL